MSSVARKVRPNSSIPELDCPRCGRVASYCAFDSRERWAICPTGNVFWRICESIRRTYQPLDGVVDLGRLQRVASTRYHAVGPAT